MPNVPRDKKTREDNVGTTGEAAEAPQEEPPRPGASPDKAPTELVARLGLDADQDQPLLLNKRAKTSAAPKKALSPSPGRDKLIEARSQERKKIWEKKKEGSSSSNSLTKSKASKGKRAAGAPSPVPQSKPDFPAVKVSPAPPNARLAEEMEVSSPVANSSFGMAAQQKAVSTKGTTGSKSAPMAPEPVIAQAFDLEEQGQADICTEEGGQ